MTDDNPKRFDRIVAILIQLQSKKIIKAQELADRFQVSLRTIYRDVKTLESSGVPIASEAGVGYSIQEGYRLPPIMFTREEATSFIAAEKLMQQFTDKSMSAHFQAAMFKIKSVLRWSEKEMYDSLDKSMMVLSSHTIFKDSISNALEILMSGIANKQQVKMMYQSFESDWATERVIEPIGMFHENNYWYVVAYCQLRKDYRRFRSDRINALFPSNTPFAVQHQRLDYYLKEKEGQEKNIIRILMDKNTAKYIRTSRHNYGFVSEEDRGDKVEMVFMNCAEDKYFSRWYVMFGDYAEILEPESLKESVRELLNNIKARL